MVEKESDYSYIEVFIKFLREIIHIVQRFIYGRDVEDGSPLKTDTDKE